MKGIGQSMKKSNNWSNSLSVLDARILRCCASF
jgi:hypothetical protein